MNDMWRPPAVALGSDPAVQLHLNYWRNRKLVRPIVGFVLLAALMFLVHRGFSMLGVLFVLLAAVTAVAPIQFRSRIGWWLPAAPSLLDGAPVVRVRGEVVGGDKSWMLLRVDGGRLHLRVTNARRPIRQFVARQREMSLIGPNADGLAAVVLDGVSFPLPAKVVPAPADPRPEPVTDEDLTRLAAAQAALLVWFGVGIVTLLGASVLFDLLLVMDGWVAATIGFVIVVLAGFIASFFRRGDQHRMVKLLRNGQWQAYPVQLLSWTGNPALVGKLRLALTLPDGSQLPVSARLAPSWLIANISATGYLWVVGSPRRDEAAVVGLPGYPFAAAVRFRELQAR
ncbi:MAG TPA: hypothetical protein VL652_25325 [Kutzneria sp.]|nr:hypothetical protein [Kutzneria sp.]